MSLRDADRFKDKIEVSLDSRQIFFLFFGGAVVACLVFVLGVMVGRRLEGREQLARKAATSAAIDPLAALDELGADERKQKDKRDDLAFPSALAGEPEERARPLGAADTAPAAAAGSTATPPAAPAPAPAPAPVADAAKKKADDEAQQKKAAEEQKKADEARRAAALAADKKAADEAKKAADDAAAKAKVDKPADKAAASAASASDKSSKKKGKYTLQLSSFQDRAEAEAFAAKVSGAGYKPYIVQSEVPDRGTYFRVRLGEYGSHEDAIAAKADFEAKQHIIAYVTRL